MSFHQSDTEKVIVDLDQEEIEELENIQNLRHGRHHHHHRIRHSNSRHQNMGEINLNPQPFSTRFLEHHNDSSGGGAHGSGSKRLSFHLPSFASIPSRLVGGAGAASEGSSGNGNGNGDNGGGVTRLQIWIMRLKTLTQWFMTPLIFRIVTTLFSFVLFVLCSVSSWIVPRDVSGLSAEQTQIIAITVLMISLWIFQSIPLAVTSLIPIFAFPLLGVMSGANVSKEYVNQVSMIFIGGFIFALAIERWRLHERIALFVLSKVGSKLPVVLIGSMSIAYVMSMWLSNTASCLILMPNCAAIIHRLKHQYSVQYGTSKEKTQAVFSGLELGLFMGIAFACNIGGIATPIGTPPNLLFAQQYAILFPGREVPNFLEWIALAGPLSFLFFVFLFFYLYWFYVRKTVVELRKSEQELEERLATSSSATPAITLSTGDSTLKSTHDNDGGDHDDNDVGGDSNLFGSPAPHTLNIRMNREPSINVYGNGESPSQRSRTPRYDDNTETMLVNNGGGDDGAMDYDDELTASSSSSEMNNQESFAEQYEKLGRMSYEEWVVAVLFSLLVILWSTRVAWQKIPIFKHDFMNDGLVAVGLGFLLFLIPAKRQDESLNSGEFVSIMDWSVMTKFPWDIIFLFGAGFSISAAFSSTGLTTVIAKNLELIKNWHPFWVMAASCTVVTFCTEVITNIATIIVFLPILAAVAQSAGTYHPLLILIPSTISSSYAFMLPIGTAPNMIAFKATPVLTISKMMKAGIWLNLFAILITTTLSYVLIPLIYGKI